MNNKTSPRKIITTTILVVLICALCTVSLLNGDEIVDNFLIGKLQFAFRKIQHPPESALIREVSTVGSSGGSDGVQIVLVAELRQYPGDAQKLRDSYPENIEIYLLEDNDYTDLNPNSLEVLPMAFYPSRNLRTLDTIWEIPLKEIDGLVYLVFLQEFYCPLLENCNRW